ncbi:MAG TPA: PVC-type heme-binding CxxCH protein [Vicinamibacterales bacterium]|nr:PVC-type heme-binding CxxCH protein [Vicinamibacterales bacterium]
MTWTRASALTLAVTLAALAARSASLDATAGRLQSRPAEGRSTAPDTPEGRPIRVLFLGHENLRHHPSSTLYPLLAAPLARRGIQLTHVWTPAEALTPEKLAHYDALLIYANHKTITPEQERALLDFVEGGKGLIAIHCASFMFLESEHYIPLIGGQFLRHGTGKFTAEIVRPDHPAMAGVKPFETWDETYVHTRHNPVNRTVLMERVDDEGREPYTWVRTQGKGRVFYTAYGHDERTWSQPGFHRLIESGILWAVDDAARRAWQRLKMPEVRYVEGFNVPNYEKRDPPPQYQLPFSPEDSMKFIQHPAEFRLELFASEPDVIKPITFSFDERGRLWVIEAHDYPNRVLRGAEGHDRIKILEDRDGDGRADTVTVFADRLNLASSLVFANGGVIVAAAPHILFLKDTDGDDKADVKEILSTGWGIEDSHAGPSNLQYAPDNHIWGVVGYSGYDGEMNGRPMKFLQGVYRFKPDGSNFELMTTSTNNTWGLGFSETFDVFGSTANNDPSFYVAIPNRYFEGVTGLSAGARTFAGPGYQSIARFYAAHHITPYIRQVDVHGGYTAAAGHHLYTARAFPRSYWNRIAFISEPTAHIVGQGVLQPNGASFETRDGFNLLAGAEEWFAPVHAQVGPDGAVWVADWYNFIAQHNPTPPGYSTGPGNAYETSMRDRHRGRIYRVVYRGAPPAKPRTLSKDDVPGLLAALASDNMLWRMHAQRLLVERGQTDVVPQLIALVRSAPTDEIGICGGAFHALWTLHGLGALQSTTSEAGRAAVAALKHPAAGVRKAAAMILPRTPEAANAILTANLLEDPDLHTRLAAILVLADMPASEAIGRALYAASNEPENFSDLWLGRALHIAAVRHREGFLTEYRRDPEALPVTALPVTLRIGSSVPDWRMPDAATLSTAWKTMEVPGAWETRGLPDFDGVVWFTRTVEWPGDKPAANLTLGRIGNLADVYINGQVLAPPPATPGTRPSTAVHALPEGLVRKGANTITVRIRNFRRDGGFLGQPEDMYLQGGDHRVPLAGTWQYRVERQTNAAALYTKRGELAAHVAAATGGPSTERRLADVESSGPSTPDVVISLSVIPHQLKYDKSELAVEAGQLVELVFTNPDGMQHNFLLGAPGSLETIGAAADALMTSPDGLAQQYVPAIPQVLFSTALVDPGQRISVRFRAPAQPGDYPYVCTFPAHWRVMNGVMHVLPPGTGRGSARARDGSLPR